MSRFADEWDDYPDYNNAADLWQANVQRALAGKRGKKALAELREALRALPEKRLISGALCTVDAPKRWDGHTQWYHDDLAHNVGHQQGEGVCAIGAYLWFKKVKAGTDPQTAFEELPTYLDTDGDSDWKTAEAGKAAGLTMTLASTLAYRNDNFFEDMSPEARYEAFMNWLDEQLADSAVTA